MSTEKSDDQDHHHHHHEGDCCQHIPVNPSLHQNLDEMEFERSIFQAAIDNNVGKIEGFSKSPDFNVNATDNYGYSALHYASRNGNLKAAKCLVKLGANVNLPTTGLQATALHRAVTANKLEMVEYLLTVGANPDLVDSDVLSSKDRAVKEKREKIVAIFAQSHSPC